MEHNDKNKEICNRIKVSNKDVCEKIETTNTKMCNEIKKIVKETNVKTVMSYVQVAARNVVMPDVSKNVPLIIRPKEKQSAERTTAELNEKVDPIIFKIPNVENRKNDIVVIRSENIAETG